MMSVELPAVNGTMTVTRLVGHDCASAALETRHPANAATHIQDRFMAIPFVSASRADAIMDRARCALQEGNVRLSDYGVATKSPYFRKPSCSACFTAVSYS